LKNWTQKAVGRKGPDLVTRALQKARENAEKIPSTDIDVCYL
jgi:hypothetical protein